MVLGIETIGKKGFITEKSVSNTKNVLSKSGDIMLHSSHSTNKFGNNFQFLNEFIKILLLKY